MILIVGCSSAEEEPTLDQIPDHVGLSTTEKYIRGLGEQIGLTTESTGWTLEEVSIVTFNARDESDTISVITDRPMLRASTPFEYTIDSLTVSYTDRKVTLTVGELPIFEEQMRHHKLTFTKGSGRETFIATQIMLDGEWRDVIQVKPDSVTFTAAGGTASLTTMDTPWVFSRIHYTDDRSEILYTDKTNNAKTFPWSYTAESGWLSIERTDVTRFTTTVKPNTSGKERSCYIVLWYGNLYNRVTVIQEAD